MAATKQEQLIEYIVQDIIAFQAQDDGCDIPQAMQRFYLSDVFTKLQDLETGLYLSGSAYVYDLFKNELEHGKLIQLEI
ncbi:hypothetical protein FACS1894104_2620 [Actinomycetota bacterium]|nr:hypothetical protein FACS1894104_2620 [Actinomycetota bacterium]